jgi:hypothetical protein
MKESPRIIYEKDVLDPKVPYVINVDRVKLIRLLKSIGVNRKVIDRLTIAVGKNDESARASLEYSREKKTGKISIHGDNSWEEYQGALVSARNISEGKEEGVNPFEGFLFTKRLPSYLKGVPKERGIVFANKLFMNAVNRELSSDLLHEAKHLADESQGKYRFWFDHAVITDKLGFLNKFDKAETSAIKFENMMKNDPKWKGVVVIRSRRPKSLGKEVSRM